jgi:hypothetical protein
MALKLSTIRACRLLSPGRRLVLISVRGWVDPRAIVRLEGLGQLKYPMTSLGIRDLPACSIVPQPSTPPQYVKVKCRERNQNLHSCCTYDDNLRLDMRSSPWTCPDNRIVNIGLTRYSTHSLTFVIPQHVFHHVRKWGETWTLNTKVLGLGRRRWATCTRHGAVGEYCSTQNL